MIKINSNLYLENDKRPDHFTFMIIYVTEFLEGIARYFLKVHKRGSTWGEAIKIYSPQGFPQVLRTWGGGKGGWQNMQKIVVMQKVTSERLPSHNIL